MFKRALQKYAKYSYFLAIGLFYSQFASSADINLVIEDQHGQKLSGAVVELINASTHSASKTLPLAVMDQVHKQFLPELLVVQQGQQVNFPNSDNIRHHVYSFSQAKPFQLRLYSGQPKEPITFNQQGVVVLGCNIHDSMVGYIYVASSESVYKSDKKGMVSLTLGTLPAQVSVWHPLQTAPLENKKIITINSQKQLVVTVNTSSPAPRNTFGSKFKVGND
ncbi:methylamine utilization protein [Pseudoalteromonas sp. S3178]|uniref:methylamine utilization protein n=1 Tax=Pseudoalteromonas sp. S3178 TaxID=579532 RepID=UPI00110B02A6|nr:methylamine utilization protein [Pseudoalteromonas sp. S3178]TMP07899.1 methylamine utilization protein [Pseudoalteromonas sp. S3178]